MTDRSDPAGNPYAQPQADVSLDAPEPRSADEVRYAGLIRRAVALTIDSVVIYGTLLGVIKVIMLDVIRPYMIPIEAVVPPYRIGITISFVLALVYYALLESSVWQGTLGKRIVSIKVTDLGGKRLTIGRASSRFLARQIIPLFSIFTGSLIAGEGGGALVTYCQECAIPAYLIQPFTTQRQAFHDLIAGTLVVKR